MPKKKKIVWFAKGGGIARCGPFDTQVEAAAAMRLAKPVGLARSVAVNINTQFTRDEFPADVFVWPEEEGD